MSTVSAVSVLVLFSCAITGSSTRAVSTDEFTIERLAIEASNLTHLMGESMRVRAEVAGALSVDQQKPVLYLLSAGDYDQSYVRMIEDSLYAAVSERRAAERQESSGKSIEVRFLEPGIVMIESRYASLVISKDEQRAPLTVRFWICPDRLSALAVFWLRRGGVLSDSSDGKPGLNLEGASDNLVDMEDAPGEATYSFSQAHMFNAPPRRDGERGGGDRMGFIRNNVVVEASTWTFIRTPAGGEWVTVGMMAGGAKEVLSVLRVLDSFIRAQVRS
jgi:hypothetical protein